MALATDSIMYLPAQNLRGDESPSWRMQLKPGGVAADLTTWTVTSHVDDIYLTKLGDITVTIDPNQNDDSDPNVGMGWVTLSWDGTINASTLGVQQFYDVRFDDTAGYVQVTQPGEFNWCAAYTDA